LLGQGHLSKCQADQCYQEFSEHGEIVAGDRKEQGRRDREYTKKIMANLTLIYGMRLLPSEELAEVCDATLKLRNGHEAHVAMHILEGSREEIEKQLKTSLDAFFDLYPEI